MYEPYQKENNGTNQTKLLNGKDKITELQQLLEDKNLEVDEMRIMQSPDDGVSQSSQMVN